ncbi:DUF2142 domain-containing protein [Homoserinimonas sp. A520]
MKVIYFAPLFAVVALFSWALASPMGAGPDDDFHLVSTWCAVVDGTSCEPGTSADTRVVPEAILESPCYMGKPNKTAACQEDFDATGSVMVLTDRGNFVGSYPPVYYFVMNAFVGSDILTSVVVMRLVNVLLFVGLTTALFWLLPVPRRQTLILMWTITTVPLGMFLIASNNPSGWAMVGVGTTWLAVLGYLERSGWQRWALGAIAVVGTLMAAGSRGDAGIYTVLGVGAVFVLTFPRDKDKWPKYALDAILPVALVAICFLFFALSSQSSSGVSGFSSGAPTGEPLPEDADPAERLTGFGRFAYNLLNIPFLWAGNFGEWGLGWLDTATPSIVTFSAISCFVAISFVALSRLRGRKLFVVAGAGLAVWALPLYVLTQGGQIVGVAVQPRYVLPLIVLLAGLIAVTQLGESVSLARLQVVLIVVALSVANAVSLHVNMRRYIKGADHPGSNLDLGIEWWWNGAPSPMFAWAVGSLAYAALLAVILRAVAWPPATVTTVSGHPEAATDVPAESAPR